MFYGTFFYLSDEQSKDTKMPTSDKVPLLNRYLTQKGQKFINIQASKRNVIFSRLLTQNVL
jgi:hypothetical protein